MLDSVTAGRVVALVLLGMVAAGLATAGPAIDRPAEGTMLDVRGPSGSAAVQECSFPFARTDASGERIRVPANPDRIVTLAPSAAQTMWEIGAADQVVGVTKYASYLEGADEKANVSGSGRLPVVEKVLLLEPDLVLAPNVIDNATVAKLRETGLTVYRFHPADDIEAIRQKTLLTGRLVGECEGAAETVEWMDDQLATVDEAVDGADRPRVLFLVGTYTAGNGTFIHDMIVRAGGTNVAAEAEITGYAPISPEVVANRDPEWIVLNSATPNVPGGAVYENTTAVREDNTLVVDENLLSQAAPRVVLVIRQLAKAFHPDAYAAAAAGTPSPTVEPGTPTPTVTPSDSPTNTGTTVPGFGLLAGVVALIVVGVGVAVGRG